MNIRKQVSWDLPTLFKYGKIFHIGNLRLDDDLTMKESKQIIEKRIIEKIHPYSIFYMESTGQWTSHLPDPTKKSGRRLIRRNRKEDLYQAIIQFYGERENINLTLDELFEKWLIYRRDETSAKPGTIRKDISTWRTQCNNVRIDEVPLGKMKVKDISTKALYRFFRILTKDRTYSRQSISNIRGVLNGMFSYAIECDIIENNPARDINLKRLPYKPVVNRSDDVFSHEEAQKLLDHLRTIDDDPYALAIRLDFNLFIRFGELSALKWENIDLDERTIYICHQLTYEPELNDDLSFTDKKMVTEQYLKGFTSQGYRTEYLTDEAVEILTKAKNLNSDGEFVFMPHGRPMINLTFNKHLKKYCEAVGIPYHSSHKIRFYAASTAYNGENLPMISTMMGHSQVGTTVRYLRNVAKNTDYSSLFDRLGSQTASKNQ